MSSLDAFLLEQVQQGRTPGAAAVVRADGARHVVCAGALHTGEGAAAVDANTVYDLASLTKLLCTTLLCARAVDQGLLQLDEAPWPAWPGVTVEHVLRHRGGLPAWRALYEVAAARGPVGVPDARRVVVDAALTTLPEGPPDVRTVYSDLGFIALGALLEERAGVPLQEQLAGLSPLQFVQLHVEGFHAATPRVAPTERCPWRRHLVVGQVHDENCYAMGGVSGHAGLFGSLGDVEAAGLALLRELQQGGTLARFAFADGERGLGFDKATPGGATGDVLGPRTVGHLGFTGTSLWIDPDLCGGALFILLTNHVHLGRDAQRIKALRRGFHREAVALLREVG